MNLSILDYWLWWLKDRRTNICWKIALYERLTLDGAISSSRLKVLHSTLGQCSRRVVHSLSGFSTCRCYMPQHYFFFRITIIILLLVFLLLLFLFGLFFWLFRMVFLLCSIWEKIYRPIVFTFLCLINSGYTSP